MSHVEHAIPMNIVKCDAGLKTRRLSLARY